MSWDGAHGRRAGRAEGAARARPRRVRRGRSSRQAPSGRVCGLCSEPSAPGRPEFRASSLLWRAPQSPQGEAAALGTHRRVPGNFTAMRRLWRSGRPPAPLPLETLAFKSREGTEKFLPLLKLVRLSGSTSGKTGGWTNVFMNHIYLKPDCCGSQICLQTGTIWGGQKVLTLFHPQRLGFN